MELTTTSYAILGLLSIRPHTAYELAGQSQRSLRFAWPTAESRLYAEPKRLASSGLIEIRAEASGPRRSRQTYRITPAGRRALRAWLRTEPVSPRIEAEVLLRVLVGDGGERADLLSALRVTREQMIDQYTDGREIVDAYLSGDVAYPDRLHLNLLWMSFVRELQQLIHDWTIFAESEIEGWSEQSHQGATARSNALLRKLAGDRPLFARRPLRRRG